MTRPIHVRHACQTYGCEKGDGIDPGRAYVDLVQGSVIDIAISPQKQLFLRCLAMCEKQILLVFPIAPRRSRSY